MTFRGSLPSGQGFNGQQYPPQSAFPPSHGTVSPAQIQFSDAPSSMGSSLHQGHGPQPQQPHPHQQQHYHSHHPQQVQQPRHLEAHGYYAPNMMAVNANMNNMMQSSAPMSPFQNMYPSAIPQQQPRQQTLPPLPHPMQLDGQSQSHLIGSQVPAYPQQHMQPLHSQGLQRAHRQPSQPLNYSPSPTQSTAPSAPQPAVSMPSPAAPRLPPIQQAVPTMAPKPAPPPILTPTPTASAPSPLPTYPASFAEAQSRPHSRPQPSPKPTVMHSPALSARSSIISKRSPSISSRGLVADSNSMLVCVAEECFTKARGSLHDIISASNERICEYQKMIATGLACLEAALQSNRLSPRQEARVRLRYASILYEDTESLMEAETALAKGIKLCDKHRLLDVKYSMAYLQAKLLLQRGHLKGAAHAVDRHISEISSHHIHWIYAFRFLKASFYLESGVASEGAALENLRAITALAHSRGDHALESFAALLEGLALIKTAKEDTLVKVQECIARASKYQLDPSVRVPQMEILVLLLDLACSFLKKDPDAVVQKTRAIQMRLDEARDWDPCVASIHLPIKKQPGMQPISEDTAAIIRPGGPQESHDYLVQSYVAKAELYILVMALSGLAFVARPTSTPQRPLDLWRASLETLERWEKEGGSGSTGPLSSLQDAVRRATWRNEVKCYIHILTGLHLATQSKWSKVKESLDYAKEALGSADGIIGLLVLYLSGVYHQGTGDLGSAVDVFSDPRFKLELGDATSGERSLRLDVSILAKMNLLWIMEHPERRNMAESTRLFEVLRALCQDHHDVEMRTAFNIILATVTVQTPPAMQQVKNSMYTALNAARGAGNTHFLAISLSIMRCRLFENVVGEQALKSAKAASTQAKRNGNLLWVSVAEGMLAHSHEVQGQTEEARLANAAATSFAMRALAPENA